MTDHPSDPDRPVDRPGRLRPDGGEVAGGAADAAVANPTFDVTPATPVTVVTERGPLDGDAIAAIAADRQALSAWD